MPIDMIRACCYASQMAGIPCEFSETTYAFNFTENLLRRARSLIRFAPIFPSTRAEGLLGGGYDLLIRFGAVPVLFQFKIPDYIQGRRGPHRSFAGPYYRFKIMPRRFSDQQQELLNHEASGVSVRYASPRFHQMNDLHSFAAAGNVPANSKILPPSVIGVLPDFADHHFDYDPTGPQFLVCSKPKPGEGDYSLESLLVSVRSALSDQRDAKTALSTLGRFADKARNSVKNLSKGSFRFGEIEKFHPVVQCAFLAEAMGCVLFLALPGHEQHPA